MDTQTVAERAAETEVKVEQKVVMGMEAKVAEALAAGRARAVEVEVDWEKGVEAVEVEVVWETGAEANAVEL